METVTRSGVEGSGELLTVPEEIKTSGIGAIRAGSTGLKCLHTYVLDTH